MPRCDPPKNAAIIKIKQTEKWETLWSNWQLEHSIHFFAFCKLQGNTRVMRSEQCLKEFTAVSVPPKEPHATEQPKVALFYSCKVFDLILLVQVCFELYVDKKKKGHGVEACPQFPWEKGCTCTSVHDVESCRSFLAPRKYYQFGAHISRFLL